MSPSRNIFVGAFVLGGVLLFALGLFLIGNRRMLFADSFHVYAEFATVAGLSNGAKVRVGGLDAGEVVELAVPPGPARKFRVKVRAIETVHPLVRTDSVATIQTDGIVGNKFVRIDPGSAQAPVARENSTIKSEEPFDIADLMQDLRQTIATTNRTIVDVKGEVESALTAITTTAKQAQELVGDTGEDIKLIAASGSRIVSDVSAIVSDIQAGKGTVGKIFKDERLYGQLRGITSDLSQTASSARAASKDVQTMIADLRARGAIDEIEKTVRNVQEVTAQLKTVMAGFNAESGRPTLTTDLRHTLASARETMSDMAENTEALKHNWFFRGFFKRRGFYDLDSLTLAQYRRGEFARGRQTARAWVPAARLFTAARDGSQALTDEGRRRIDQEMSRLIQYPRNSIIMVEGYAGEGSPAEQRVTSLDRAVAVREYVVRKYQWNPNYVGIMPMGAVRSEGGGPFWDGVALALFYRPEDTVDVRTASGRAERTVETDGPAARADVPAR